MSMYEIWNVTYTEWEYLYVEFVFECLCVSDIYRVAIFVCRICICVSLYMWHVGSRHGQPVFAVIEAHESMELEAVVILIRGVLLLIFTPIIFALGGNLWWFILLLLIIAISKFLQSNYFMITRFVRPRLAFDMKFWGALIIEAYPLAFISIFAILYFRIDSVMLSIYSNEEAVGIYNAAYSFMAVLQLFHLHFSPQFFPDFLKLSMIK